MRRCQSRIGCRSRKIKILKIYLKFEKQKFQKSLKLEPDLNLMQVRNQASVPTSLLVAQQYMRTLACKQRLDLYSRYLY